jgi:hypothetical protein
MFSRKTPSGYERPLREDDSNSTDDTDSIYFIVRTQVTFRGLKLEATLTQRHQ